MNIDTLEKLYIHELKDLYSAENQILDALPKMVRAASDADLVAALNGHVEQTKAHRDRVTSLFETLDFEPGGHKCKGIEGLLKEASELLQEVTDDHVRDAAIISACQRVEHYEMAGYGVARALAKKLGRDTDVDTLTKTIEEEGAADRKLTELAEHHINFVAQVN
ncbi:yciF [Symbiodinium necroappetens]|uniref:YciF protein n=1 Tax=Symbiodinium necroappetens TaxID=1628268 RepID=A0A812K9S7_9DINO|nr:yciF [Symbiodinium necroappetens]